MLDRILFMRPFHETTTDVKVSHKCASHREGGWLGYEYETRAHEIVE